jgi:hypothetical protein
MNIEEVHTVNHSPLRKMIVLYGILPKGLIEDRKTPKRAIKNQRGLRSMPSRARARGLALQGDNKSLREKTGASPGRLIRIKKE